MVGVLIGGLLGSSGAPSSDQGDAASLKQEPRLLDQTRPTTAPPSTANFDLAKWRALLEYDPDIARVEEVLRPHGQKYVNQFATEYLTLNDKAYITNITKKVVETVKQDAAEAKALE